MTVPAVNTTAFIDLVNSQIRALWKVEANRPPSLYPADEIAHPGQLQNLNRKMSSICGPTSLKPADNMYWKVYIWPEDVRPAVLANMAAPYSYYNSAARQGNGYSDGMNFYLYRWMNPGMQGWIAKALTFDMYKMMHQINGEPDIWAEEYLLEDRKAGQRTQIVETPFVNSRLAVDLQRGITFASTNLKLFSISDQAQLLAYPLVISTTGVRATYKRRLPVDPNGGPQWQRYGDSTNKTWQAYILSNTRPDYSRFYESARSLLMQDIEAAQAGVKDAPMNILRAIATFIRSLNLMQIFPGGNERTNIMLVLNGLMLAYGFGLPIGGKHRRNYDLRALRWICCGCFSVEEMAQFLWLAQDFGVEEKTRGKTDAEVRRDTIFA